MHLEVENCDAAVQRAADAGATVTMAPWDALWGARYGRIIDPFGHSWRFAHPPPAVGVGRDDPVRVIDAFVDGLDLEDLRFSKVAAEDMGRPPYAPGDLLKLYIYGYLHRIRASRRLEAETHRNVQVMWLIKGLTTGVKG